MEKYIEQKTRLPIGELPERNILNMKDTFIDEIEIMLLDDLFRDINFCSTDNSMNSKLLLEKVDYLNDLEKEVEALDKYMRESLDIVDEIERRKTSLNKNNISRILIVSGTVITGASISLLSLPIFVVLGTKVALGTLGVASCIGYYYIKK